MKNRWGEKRFFRAEDEYEALMDGWIGWALLNKPVWPLAHPLALYSLSGAFVFFFFTIFITPLF